MGCFHILMQLCKNSLYADSSAKRGAVEEITIH